jgi:hypothetical protein
LWETSFTSQTHFLGQYANYANTLSFGVEKGSPKAVINDISWIAGSWRGEAMGGVTEELWSLPLAGSMMGSFKFITDGKVKFYEPELISEEAGTLILRLKHFHANLKGWEKKDETVEFRLVKITNKKVYFDNLTFEKVGENEMNIFVVIEDGEEKEEVSLII